MSAPFTWREQVNMELRAYLFWMCVNYGYCIPRDEEYRLIAEFDFDDFEAFVEGLMAADGAPRSVKPELFEKMLAELHEFLKFFKRTRLPTEVSE